MLFRSLAFARSGLGLEALLKVGLGVPGNVSEKLGELARRVVALKSQRMNMLSLALVLDLRPGEAVFS